jgi:peptide/nickel transport system permease protein
VAPVRYMGGNWFMGRTLLVRLGWAIPTMIVVTLLVFVLLDLAPGDPARLIAGENANEQVVQQIRERLNLDDPLIVRYVDWLSGAVQGDLQTSLVSNQPVTGRIASALPATFSLVGVALVVALTFALVVGTAPVLWRHPLVDRVATVLASLAISVPGFWLGLILASTFAVSLGWLPAIGYEPISSGLWSWLSHLILPAIALAMLTAGELARQLRASLMDAVQSDYALAAYARGISFRRVVLKHGLKNAAIPVVTVLGVRTSQLLGGTVVIESLFVISGVGRLTVNAVFTRDIPIVLGVVLVTTVIVIAVNVMVDLSYAYFNPRARIS